MLRSMAMPTKLPIVLAINLLIDHRMAVADGSSRRKIVRMSGPAGIEAVDITVRAARFLSKHRNGYALALNAQGSTPQQYFECVQQIVSLLQENDVLGLRGILHSWALPFAYA